MSHCLFALAALGAPWIKGTESTPLRMHDPSTLELAMMGFATLAVYWVGKRWLSSGKRAAAAMESGDNRTATRQESEDEQQRGAA